MVALAAFGVMLDPPTGADAGERKSYGEIMDDRGAGARPSGFNERQKIWLGSGTGGSLRTWVLSRWGGVDILGAHFLFLFDRENSFLFLETL